MKPISSRSQIGPESQRWAREFCWLFFQPFLHTYCPTFDGQVRAVLRFTVCHRLQDPWISWCIFFSVWMHMIFLFIWRIFCSRRSPGVWCSWRRLGDSFWILLTQIYTVGVSLVFLWEYCVVHVGILQFWAMNWLLFRASRCGGRVSGKFRRVTIAEEIHNMFWVSVCESWCSPSVSVVSICLLGCHVIRRWSPSRWNSCNKRVGHCDWCFRETRTTQFDATSTEETTNVRRTAVWSN